MKDKILRHFVPQNDRKELCIKLYYRPDFALHY